MVSLEKNIKRIAAVDLGTNTFRYLIVDYDTVSQSKTVIAEKEVFVKVFEKNSQIITDEKLKLAEETLKNFSNDFKKYKVDFIKAIATEAWRSAENGMHFINEIKKSLSLEIEIIDGQKESDYAFQAVCSLLDDNHQPFLLMDIGGGSTEFVFFENKKILYSVSFPIGSSKVKNKFPFSDPPKSSEIAYLKGFYQDSITDLKSISIPENASIIGLSGAFETLGSIMSKDKCPLLLEVKKEDFTAVTEDVLAKNPEEIKLIPGMHPLRADLMPYALLLIEVVMRQFSIKSVFCTTVSLRNALADEMASEKVNRL
ncbi:MAG: hypothetical protein EA412_06535 [Chitinophagaceae bacterium]|nr:MAG: hypothetical protein EA412_06535 [Chitinophagaceae bacterium]